ncbi:piggyBac transposable element-derived protein 4 [Trichonephila clavipes]|nr:piggyBac transposable element-derived protein 4 [Trichonephila clavipes]
MHSPRNELIIEERKDLKKFDGDVSLCEKEKLTTTKPKIVADYNKHMGYVDLGDRMSSTYSFARRTRKWTKKLFFSLIDIAVLNAFLMFKSCRTSSKFSLKEFRMNLITSLIGKINHKNAEHPVTKKFVEWAQNEIAVVPNFHKRILFSDEAHFWLNGYVNKQNCRIWSEANPQVYVETPLHPEKLTVWCALWAGGILLQKR